MADLCEELHGTLGVNAMKLKAGVMPPDEEARVIELCRERLGPSFGLRIDPNGTWSVATATRIGRRLEPMNMEYFEDPAWGLEGNAPPCKAVRIPIATNMYPNKFDDLGPAIRLGAVDIVLTDIHYWEGPRGVKDLAAGLPHVQPRRGDAQRRGVRHRTGRDAPHRLDDPGDALRWRRPLSLPHRRHHRGWPDEICGRQNCRANRPRSRSDARRGEDAALRKIF